jgi:hypothetical protein
MTRMTEVSVADVLRDAGWTSDRRIEVAEQVDALRAAGFETWNALADHLASFDGLTFEETSVTRDVVLDARRAASEADPFWTLRYAGVSGVRLAPVGFAYRGHLTLLLAEDGRFFGGYDDWFGTVGDDFESALSALLNDQVQLTDTSGA